MSGYRNRPEETAAALRRRLALYRRHRRIDRRTAICFILDRKKDMAIVGGFNVYPARGRGGAVRASRVAEAAVIGVPDSYRGEALIGYVVLRRPDASETGDADRAISPSG
jgi:long-chain acyl-CoA synthetase